MEGWTFRCCTRWRQERAGWQQVQPTRQAAQRARAPRRAEYGVARLAVWKVQVHSGFRSRVPCARRQHERQRPLDVPHLEGVVRLPGEAAGQAVVHAPSVDCGCHLRCRRGRRPVTPRAVGEQLVALGAEHYSRRARVWFLFNPFRSS